MLTSNVERRRADVNSHKGLRRQLHITVLLPFIEDLLLPTSYCEVFPDHYDSVPPVTVAWTVPELHQLLGVQTDILELTIRDDPSLHVRRSSPRLCFADVLRWTIERLPLPFRYFLSLITNGSHRVESEDEPHSLVVPNVEVPRDAEVRVPSQRNPTETGLAAKIYRLVYVQRCTLVRGTVPTETM